MPICGIYKVTNLINGKIYIAGVKVQEIFNGNFLMIVK